MTGRGVDAIRRLYAYFAGRMRPRRMQEFLRRMAPDDRTPILDIGGVPAFWEGTDLNVTVLNLKLPEGHGSALEVVEGDATALPFADGSFEIAFSNSMIEHLYTRENQLQAATEAMRVGRRLWIQTPNRWFPIEPHFLTPFVHWLPRGVRRRIVRNFTVWGLLARPTPDEAARTVDEINLLSARDLRRMFPGCTILRERFLGMTKSLIVVR